MSMASNLFNATAQVQRSSGNDVSDGQGGWTRNFVTIATPRCRVRPARPGEQSVGEQQQEIITHIVYMRAGTNIVSQDRIVVKGKTLRVYGVQEPSLSGDHIEVKCEEIKDA